MLELREKKSCSPSDQKTKDPNDFSISFLVFSRTDKIENRYCGGPHTLTTPVQRVTRLGHFLEQWGPEITTANETLIKGTDQKVITHSVIFNYDVYAKSIRSKCIEILQLN